MAEDAEPAEQTRYRAFLSYSHQDAGAAAWLHRALEAYRVPRQLVGEVTRMGPVPRRLTPIFRDREELASATDLGAVLNEALAASQCQIVVCSPHAARSKWVNEEILAFRRLGRSDRIFCLIVDGEPNASDDPTRADEECFPPALRFQSGEDGQADEVRVEPIAADARAGKDGRNDAKLKLIAGLLDVGFDALKQREQQRRGRQLIAVAAASAAGMALTTGLAGVALVERASAQKQAARAEAEAATARQTTKFLVNLFQVSDPSEAHGNTVTAREILDRGAKRIGPELSTQPATQAALMDSVGAVYTNLGLFGQAKPMLEAAVTRRSRLNPPDPLALSESLFHEAQLSRIQGNYEEAAKRLGQAIALQRPRIADLHARALLASSLVELGVVLGFQGRHAEAERSYRQSLAMRQGMPPDPGYDAAQVMDELAKELDQEGDLKAAIAMMQDALGMERKLHGSEPHPNLSEATNDLGLLLEENGDYDRAAALFSQSLAMNRRLYPAKHPETANSLNNLGGVLQDKGDLVGAESAYREALRMQRDLVGDVHPAIALLLNNLASVDGDRGDFVGAARLENQSLAVYRKLFPGDHPEVARAMNRTGCWLTKTGQYREARQKLEEALAMRRRLVGDSHPDVASSLTCLAILQVTTRQYPAALSSAHTAAAIFSKALSPDHWRTAVAQSAEGAALMNMGRRREAEPLLKRSVAILAAAEGAPRDNAALARSYLDQFYRNGGSPQADAGQGGRP
jgi:tetratricopeptide (TPR) repeat protein